MPDLFEDGFTEKYFHSHVIEPLERYFEPYDGSHYEKISDHCYNEIHFYVKNVGISLFLEVPFEEKAMERSITYSMAITKPDRAYYMGKYLMQRGLRFEYYKLFFKRAKSLLETGWYE